MEEAVGQTVGSPLVGEAGELLADPQAKLKSGVWEVLFWMMAQLEAVRGMQASEGTEHILQLMLEALLGSLALKVPLAKPHKQRLCRRHFQRQVFAGEAVQKLYQRLLFAFFFLATKT